MLILLKQLVGTQSLELVKSWLRRHFVRLVYHFFKVKVMELCTLKHVVITYNDFINENDHQLDNISLSIMI